MSEKKRIMNHLSAINGRWTEEMSDAASLVGPNKVKYNIAIVIHTVIVAIIFIISNNNNNNAVYLNQHVYK